MRTYDNKEISAIIRRAIELKQHQARDRDGISRTGKEEGVTIEDLQQVAAELGIEPEYVLTAAQELANEGKIQIAKGVLGAPGFIGIEHTVDGVISENTWDELLAEIRRVVGEMGRAEKIGDSLEWRGSHTHVTIGTRDNKTVIRAGWESRQSLLLSYVLTFEAALVSLAILLPTLLLPNEVRVAIAGSGMVGAGFLAREIVHRWARKKHARLQEIIAQLTVVVQQHTQLLLEKETLAQPRFSETKQEKQNPESASQETTSS